MIYYGTKTLNEWKPNLSERKRKQFEQSKEATYVIISFSNSIGAWITLKQMDTECIWISAASTVLKKGRLILLKPRPVIKRDRCGILCVVS